VTTSEERRVVGVIETGDDGRLRIGDVRRAQIVRSVRRLIATEGFEAVTIARIAKDIGCSRGVVNHHFKNKDQIMHDALQEAVADANRASEASLPGEGGLGRLTGAVVDLTTAASDWWPLYVAYLAKSGQDDFYRREVAAADRRHRGNLAQVLGDESRATVVLALMKGLALERLVDDTLDLERAVAEVTALLDGWRPTTAPGSDDAPAQQRGVM
jgi:AcrR family transcriptional regulator